MSYCTCAYPDNDFDTEESATYKAIMRKCLSNVIASDEDSWNFGGAEFGDADVAAIVKGLEGNTTVTKLDLCDNRFTEAGLQEIAKMMENNSTIETVLLSGTYTFRLVSRARARAHTHTHTHTHTSAHRFAG